MSANSDHDHIIYRGIAYKSKETKTSFDIIDLLLLFSNQVSHNIINYVINRMEKMSASSEYDYTWHFTLTLENLSSTFGSTL